ncbi:autotransporter-associated N-terminal domain-containing protein [Fusobacterium simiae]|uniref:autotransporter-associated N-terminal domain-containing protein n=2 Tax=Fusobacteriaceae TaxID=203492 RepID=UPI00041F9038|nr:MULTISPECIES: autotransporter-associated N-terminal domain-containing protein [Fusobacterium]MDC7954276.1 autotransporter-associated N-terminal domain-containing protein [Fusobacterium simiae]
MGNNLYKVEKDLRSIAKRYKSVKYSLGLAILFLMLGVSAFSEDIISNEITSQVATREEIKDSVGNVQTKLNILRDENKEKIKNLRLELIQLMEQGDQVIKSPWASWQFGMNYFYDHWGSEYKGRGDKAQKYLFNGVYTRGNWKVRNAMDALESQRVGGAPLTPGNDSQNSWKDIDNSSSGGVTIEKDSSIGSSTNGNRSWGLVNLEDLKEPTNEVEILARISPKEVTKQAVNLNITEPKVEPMEAPNVNPQVNEPLPAPVITLPVIETVTINPLTINAPSTPGAPNAPSISIGITAPVPPTAPDSPDAPTAPSAPSAPSAPTAPGAPSVPSISVSPSTPGTVTAPTITINVAPPTITALNIATPGTVGKISTTPPSVSPVDFILSPAGLSQTHNFQNKAFSSPGSKIIVQNAGGKRDYISVWGYVANMNNISTDVDVNIANTRAFMVDEGIDEKNTAYAPFRYIGTITLNKSQNVGIDVQGTHTSYDSSSVNTDAKYKSIAVVANIKVTNAGTIIGNGGAGIQNQVAFGFNNFDSSTNNTRTEMINVGQITLNAPNSAGIQLRPENPNTTSGGANNKKGLNMMTARNEKEVSPTTKTGTVDIKSYGSFGMLTVKNKNATTTRDYNTNDYKTISSIGGQFANRAQVENMSLMKNTGVINLDGDSSIGIGILHNIQAVYAGGTINIGENNPSTFTYANKTGKNASKTEGAVGVYAEVETRPVLKDKYDDHGLKNTTGKTVGTETVEVDGTINIGDYATESSGIFAKDKGSITLKNNSGATTSSSDANVVANLNKGTGTINVGGEKNYGAVVDGIAYKSKQKNAQNQYETESVTDDKIGRIDLEKGTAINVTGKESIGYVLQKGAGSNSGKINVVGHNNNNTTGGFHGSLGFYGEKGTFTNTADGTISSSGNIAHAVALVGDATDGITFSNAGKIETTGKGNIGVYADDKYIFNHSGSNATINVGTNALGIYAKSANGTLNINAPIVLAASGTGANAGTTIGVYSDGDAKVNFGENSKLTIGKGAVGLYSSDVTKFKDTFKVVSGKSLTVELGQNSTFGLLDGTTGKTVNVGTYLSDNSVNITSFGSGASLFYTTGGASSVLDKNYTVTNGGAASTAVLVGAKGSTVKIDTGITLTTNTNVGLIATKAGGTTASTAENAGNIISTRDKGIGIYTNESIGISSGTITMQNKESVGILGENNSTLTNSKKIELAAGESAGIYGKDSDVTNSGNGADGIYVKGEKSAGIYGLLTSAATGAKTLNNTGLVKLENNKSGSAGIYAKLDNTATNKLSTQNSGTIEVAQSGSAGIYAENKSSQVNTKSDVTNSGLVKMSGASSVGIIGEKSKITNSGTGTNKGIEISGTGSAGILASKESNVINSGRIEGKTGANLVGISVDNNSTVTNSGTITMGTTSNTGISTKGGDVTNSGTITLSGVTSTGISSENANVTNTATTGKIEVKNGNSMGIYSKSNGAVDRTVTNAGEISLNTPTGLNPTPEKSAAIYSLLDAGSSKLTTTNTATIKVDQKGSAGIYAKNNAGTNTNSIVTNSGIITVSKESSAGILGEKSTITNSGTGTNGIVLSANKTAGIIGNNDSKVSNAGRIETTTVSPLKAEDGLVGISLNASTGTNETTGTITLGTDFSTGMYGENTSTLTNAGTISGNKQKAVGMAAKASTATNNSGATITLSGANSTGMFGLAVGSNKSTLTNSGTINGNGVGAVGIAADNSTAINSGGATITLIEKSSTGMFGKAGSVVSNAGTIETKTTLPSKIEEGLVGIALNASTGTNSGAINLGTAYSTGIFGENDGSNKSTITNIGSITGTKDNIVGIAAKASTATNNSGATITLSGANSTGMFGLAVGSNKSTLTNSGTINGNGVGAVGIALNKSEATNKNGATITLQGKGSTGIFGKAASTVSNAGVIELKAASPTKVEEGLVGIALDASTATNETNGEIKIETKFSTGMFGENKSTLTNAGKITGDKEKAVGIAAKDSAATNSGTITLSGIKSTGMFGLTAGSNRTTLKNSGIITGTGEGTVGIAAEKSTVTNDNTAKIILEGKKSTGIFGKAKSNVTNAGEIELKIAVPGNAGEGLAGIALNDSTATNTSSGKIKIETKYSTGMFGENASTLINEGSITGSQEYAVGMAGKASTVTNKETITLGEKNSTGMFGENNSTLLNDTAGNITVKEESSVGIYSKGNNKIAENKGIILAEKKKSAGMLGNEGNLENTNSITTQDEESAGMYVENSNAVNKRIINANGKKSAGIYVKLDKAAGGTISGTNEGANAVITMANEGSAGMLGEVKSTVTASSGTLTLTNQNNIVINSKESVGMMLTNDATNVSKDNVKAINKGTIDLNSSSTNKDNIGILANKRATGINEKNINVNSKSSVGMLAKEGSSIQNNTTSGIINLKNEAGIGMLADGKDTNNNISTAINNARIVATSAGTKSLGMLAQNYGKVENAKTIEILAQEGVGIFVSETGTGKNLSGGTITLENKEAVGMFAKNNGSTHTAENAGIITLGKADKTTTQTSLIGMFAQAEAGKTASVKNTGTINVNTKASVGMYAKNDASNMTDVDLQNTGTINVNNTGSAGIYAPKANISKVGKINLENSTHTNGSSAVYVSDGGKVSDTASAEISLGTVNQNRVAYYVNGANSSLSGANIGKIIGYGVGVYLQGNSSSDKAKIDNNTPTLNYKAVSGATGDGIIGLFLNGDTDIQSYTNGITVGNTVPRANPSDKPKYAIGIYANAQGTSSSLYNIATSITAGKNGVGIYADKDSHIKYTGNMEIGDGTTAGTGIFITKKVGANGGTVELGSNTIKLKGTGGVAVIASEGTKFDGKTATIELEGTNVQGVGVYAKKGSSVNISTWTFNNHGNAAEEVRSEEGGAYITANKQLKPKMVLTHVINGETSIASGKSVTSIADGKYKAEANIGLMAEGVKNPTAPLPLVWQEGNFEIVNHGTIDFSAAERSTAIFANSARAKNDGTIKVGKNSTAIYGFYDKDTRKYDGAPTSPDPNKLELETTANSKISLGDSSTGMYLINASKITNTGGQITSDKGATKNVGIYAINGQSSVGANNKTLTMTTATNITLGNGSVGLYSKGQSNTNKNTVTNTGNITVGDKITVSKTENYPAVAMYAENTNLNTNSTVTVGKDGIAFYGKNSTIDAKGAVNFQNKGVLAYLENSKFVSHLGNLGATQNTMLYLKNSIAQLDGSGTKVDIDVADGYTGAYVEGNSQLTGIKTIKLGKDSTGLYLQNTTPNFVSTAESITGTKDKARGISGVNSNFTNNSKISLSGAESVAIYSKNSSTSTKYVVNNGELNLSGKKTLGAFLRGNQTFENKANINIANSTDSKNPTIGIYTATSTEGSSILEGANIKHTSGTIEVGEKSIGIYSKTPSNVEMNGGKIHVKDQGIGIYKEDGKLTIKGEINIDKHTATAKDSEPTGVYAVNGANVVDNASKISIGAKSYGFILNNSSSTKTNTYNSGSTGTVSLGNESVFLYSNGKANIINNRTINANGSDHLIAFYIKNGGDFTNNGTINFSTGKGNIGIYAPGGKATNTGKVYVGKTDDIDPATGKVYTDVSKIVYGIGMAADNKGHIVNDGEIRIYNNKSIGMYGSGVGTVVENGVNGKIFLDGSRATATDKIQSMTGVYVDEGATFRNFGTIQTTDSYAGRNGKVNENVSGLTGVAVMNGSTLINEASGKILIDADNSSGVVIRGKRDANGILVRNAVIKNYGEIRVRGKGTTAISWKDVSPSDIADLQKMINDKISSDPSGRELGEAGGTNKEFKGVTITVKNGEPIFTRDGKLVSADEVQKINQLIGSAPNLAMSDVGFYVDTLGKTRPVTFDGANPPVNSQLIIGTEYSEKTNKKEWFVSGNVIKPFLDQIQGRNFKLTTLAGSLTWIATPVLDNYGQITGVAMSKLSYTTFVKPEDNAYNFTVGLEQRYNMNGIDSAEKRIFNKLNGIGKNEDTLLTQAYDEMMGHQYANVQQRVQATGKILDKEFNHLRDSWSNPTKDSNKVKTFGMKGEYKTDTAGVIDYKYNAYGAAYVHENEDIKLGRGIGWHTGIVHNTFKFKDIGNSKEEQLQAKVGLFKSVPFDENNSLNWTISGDIFVGHNKMERKFLVVDEVFHAKSKYYTYGIGITNEIGKEFRLSEGFSIRPYGALKVEYGRVSKIKEKSGEMKLEVKENDYLSIRPEIGTELAYKHYFGTKTLRTSVGVAYENELGRVANGKNKARVADTTADWFNIRGEKEDRKGNVKFDLNVGLDNQRLGVTGNVGYDTKGSNVRGGVGLRVIF